MTPVEQKHCDSCGARSILTADSLQANLIAITEYTTRQWHLRQGQNAIESEICSVFYSSVLHLLFSVRFAARRDGSHRGHLRCATTWGRFGPTSHSQGPPRMADKTRPAMPSTTIISDQALTPLSPILVPPAGDLNPGYSVRFLRAHPCPPQREAGRYNRFFDRLLRKPAPSGRLGCAPQVSPPLAGPRRRGVRSISP